MNGPELSDAALDRNVGPKNRVNVFADQIKNIRATNSHIRGAETAIGYIRRSGSLSDGRIKAMELLMDTADRYREENGEWNFTSDTYRSGDRESAIMEALMDELIRAQYQAMQSAKQHWDTSSLQEKIEEVVEERWPAEVDFGSCDMRAREDLFANSMCLLQLVESRRTAVMLAGKVTGHRLPAELVGMVQDYICSDDHLMTATGQLSGGNESTRFPWPRPSGSMRHVSGIVRKAEAQIGRRCIGVEDAQRSGVNPHPCQSHNSQSYVESGHTNLAASLTNTSFSHIRSIVTSFPPASELLEKPHCGLKARQPRASSFDTSCALAITSAA